MAVSLLISSLQDYRNGRRNKYCLLFLPVLAAAMLRLFGGAEGMGWIEFDALRVNWMDDDTFAIQGEMWHWREEET